ncbi:hypothetical protein ABPG72_013164 [Tetrahymena utriculariae]
MEEAEAVEFSPSYRILEVTEESDEESNHNHLKNEFSNSQHESHQDTAQSAKNQYQTHKQPQEIIEIDENLDDGEEQSFQYSKKKVDSSGKEIEEFYQNMSFQNSPNQPQVLQVNNNSNLQPSQKINQNVQNAYGYINQQQQQQLQQQQQQQFQNGVPSFNIQIQRNGEKYELKSASKNLMQTFSNTQNQQNNQQADQNVPIQVFKPQTNFNDKQKQSQNLPPQEEETRERKLSVQPVRLIDQEAFLMKASPQNQNNRNNSNVNYCSSNNNINTNTSVNTSQNSRNNQRAQANSSDKKRHQKNSQQNDQQFQNQVQFLINKRSQAQLKKDQALSSQKKQMLNQQLLNASDDEMENIVPMSSNPNKLPLTLVQQENLEKQYKEVLLELESTQKQLDEVEKSLRIETLNFEESKRHVLILKMALQQKVEENTLQQILAEVSHDARINKVDLYTYLARQMNQQQLEGDKNKHRVVELERQVKKLKQINEEQSRQMQQLQEFNESINVELKNAIYALQMAEDEKERMLAEQRQQIQDQNSHEKDQLLDYLTECKNQINILQQEIINLKHQVNSKALHYSIASDHSNPNKNSQVQQQITAGDVNNISNGFSNNKQQLSANQHLSPEQLFSNLSNNKLNNQDNSFSHQNNQTSLNFSKNINNDSAEGKNSLLSHHQEGNVGTNMQQYIHHPDDSQRQDQSHTQNYHLMQQPEDQQNYHDETSQHSIHQPQNLQKRFQDDELEELLKEIEESNIVNMQPEVVVEKLNKLGGEAKRLKQEIEQNNLVIQDYKMRQENERQNYSEQIKQLFEQLSQTRQELRSKKDQFEQLESNQIGLEEQIESQEQILQQKQEEYEKVNEDLRQLRQIAGDRLQEMNKIKLKYEIENSALQQEVEHLNVIVQEYQSSINQDKNSSEERSSSMQFNSQRSGQQTAIRQSNSPKNYNTFQTGNLAKQGNEQNQLLSRQTQEQESTQHYNVSTLNSQVERLQSEIYSKEQQIQQLVEEIKQKDLHIHRITDDFQKQIQHLNQQIEDIQNEKETIIHENEYCKKEVQKLMEKDIINTNKLKDKKEVKQLQQQLDTKQLEVEKLLLEKENLNYFVEAYRKFIFNENTKRAIQEYIGVIENTSSLEYQRRENVHKINSLEKQQTLEEYQNDIIKIKEEIISLKENQFTLDDQKKVLLTRKIQLEKELESITISQSDRYESWQTLEEDYQEIKKKVERQVREFTLKEITYNNVQTAYNDLLKEYGRLLSQSIIQQKKPLMRNQSAQGGQTFILNKSLQSNLSQNQFSPNKKSTIQEVSAEENSQITNNYTMKICPDEVQGKKSRYDSSHHNNDITSSNYYDNMLIIDNEEDVYNQQASQHINNFIQNKEIQQNLD